MRMRILMVLLLGSFLWYVMLGTTPAMLVPQPPAVTLFRLGRMLHPAE